MWMKRERSKKNNSWKQSCNHIHKVCIERMAAVKEWNENDWEHKSQVELQWLFLCFLRSLFLILRFHLSCLIYTPVPCMCVCMWIHVDIFLVAHIIYIGARINQTSTLFESTPQQNKKKTLKKCCARINKTERKASQIETN